MKIDLEKYIRSHRSQLDNVEIFDVDEMWNAFDRDHKPIRKIQPWYYAAAAAAVLLIGILIVMNVEQQVDRNQMVYEQLKEIDPELAEEQTLMVQLIESQDSLIKNLGITEMQFPDLFNELQIIDSLHMETIHDLDNYRDRQNLTRTLLRHYQRKARVLELMLYEFEKQESEFNYENDKQI